jgi:hypothetical protein
MLVDGYNVNSSFLALLDTPSQKSSTAMIQGLFLQMVNPFPFLRIYIEALLSFLETSAYFSFKHVSFLSSLLYFVMKRL